MYLRDKNEYMLQTPVKINSAVVFLCILSPDLDLVVLTRLVIDKGISSWNHPASTLSSAISVITGPDPVNQLKNWRPSGRPPAQETLSGNLSALFIVQVIVSVLETCSSITCAVHCNQQTSLNKMESCIGLIILTGTAKFGLHFVLSCPTSSLISLEGLQTATESEND